MRRRRPVSDDVLRERLDALVATFDISTIEPDPLQLVLRYDDPLDQEVAGLIAAAFAYGAQFDGADAEQTFRGFSHRFHKTAELLDFLEHIAAVVKEHGSLGGL